MLAQTYFWFLGFAVSRILQIPVIAAEEAGAGGHSSAASPQLQSGRRLSALFQSISSRRRRNANTPTAKRPIPNNARLAGSGTADTVSTSEPAAVSPCPPAEKVGMVEKSKFEGKCWKAGPACCRQKDRRFLLQPCCQIQAR